jgi:hypothetical protein
MSFKDVPGKTISGTGKYLTVWKEQADNHSESYFASFLEPTFRRFRAGEPGAALRVTNLRVMPSKSCNTSELTRERRTSTALSPA